jgi:hypothetical protein
LFVLPVEYAVAIFKMEEIDNLRETMFRELLVLGFQEAEGDFANEGCPPGVAADGSHDVVAEGKGIEVEDGSGGLPAKAAALAAFELVK